MRLVTPRPLAAFLFTLVLAVAPVVTAPVFAQHARPAPEAQEPADAPDPGSADAPFTDSARTRAPEFAHAVGPEADTATSDLAESRLLARRLQETDGLADVSVTVRGGVAELQGVVLDAADRERAEQVASQQPGITRVENRVTLSTRFSDRLATAGTLARDKIVRLIAALPLLLVALVVVVLAWWAGRWLGRRLGQRIAQRDWQSENPYFASLVQQLVQWLVLLGGVLVALDLLGATALVGAVMGSAGVIGLALGFAFKDIAENYVAGVLLSIRRPFAPGELLRIDGTHEGRVAALTPRATVMVTHDGNRLTLPNALVFKSVVLNFSSNARRRLEFVVPIDVSESIRCVQELAMDALRGTRGVLADPGPSWTVDTYDAAAMTLRFFAWVDQRESDLGKVRSEAIHAVRTRLAEAGINAPRNIQFTASLPEPEAEALAATAVARPATYDTVTGDTSVNHDLDDHLAEEQRAHAREDLMPVEADIGAEPAPAAAVATGTAPGPQTEHK